MAFIIGGADPQELQEAVPAVEKEVAAESVEAVVESEKPKTRKSGRKRVKDVKD